MQRTKDKKYKKLKIKPIFLIFIILVFVFGFSLIIILNNILKSSSKKTIYEIDIDKPISYSTYDIDYLEDLIHDKKISADGYLIIINSPGGDAQASYKLAYLISKLKGPKICYIKEIGASGAYWIASKCDKIVSEPFAIVGSIGVKMGYLSLSGFLNKYGIKYISFSKGPYKDIGDPFVNITPEQKKFLQNKINILYNYFVDDVIKSRPFINKTVFKSGFYLGIEAKKLGLVDYIGDKYLAIQILAKDLNTTPNNLKIEKIDIKKEEDILDNIFSYSLTKVFPFLVPKIFFISSI